MDSKSNNLNLKLNARDLDRFCKKIIARSRNSANTHEALTVLEAFISTFSSDSQGTEQYNIIQQTLKSHSSKTREKLMQEKTLQLQNALIEKNINQLANIYTSLSRNGFYQILAKACEQIEADTLGAIIQWVNHWSTEARQKAEQASGYPDALDFKKANINIEHYQSMSDISHYLITTYNDAKL